MLWRSPGLCWYGCNHQPVLIEIHWGCRGQCRSSSCSFPPEASSDTCMQTFPFYTVSRSTNMGSFLIFPGTWQQSWPRTKIFANPPQNLPRRSTAKLTDMKSLSASLWLACLQHYPSWREMGCWHSPVSNYEKFGHEGSYGSSLRGLSVAGQGAVNCVQ